MRTVVLAVLACGACATIDVPVTNDNYESRARPRAPSERAIDHVRRGEDPCADEPGHESRPAIETVVRAGDADDAPVPDEGGGCTVWGPGRFRHVNVRGAAAIAPSLVGGHEVATIDRDGTLFRRGLLGTEEGGEVRCGKLVMLGLVEDRIVARIEPGAVITTGLFSRRYARASACSDRQAALGAFALMVLEEERARAQQQANDDRKAKDEARHQQEQRDDQLRRQRDQDSWDRLRKSHP